MKTVGIFAFLLVVTFSSINAHDKEFIVDDFLQVQRFAPTSADAVEFLESEEFDDSEELSKEHFRNPVVKKIIKKVAGKAVKHVAKKALCNKETCRRKCNRQGLNGN